MSPKHIEMTAEEQKIIITHHNDEKSLKYIAYITGTQQSKVQSIVKRYKNENQFENKHQSGRSLKLSE